MTPPHAAASPPLATPDLALPGAADTLPGPPDAPVDLALAGPLATPPCCRVHGSVNVACCEAMRGGEVRRRPPAPAPTVVDCGGVWPFATELGYARLRGEAHMNGELVDCCATGERGEW